MPKTQLKKLTIEKFRALNSVQIEFGDYITVICGKNGTSKSSILGIAAQIFSFERDYAENKLLPFRQIAGGTFKSQYSEHFRISDKFDIAGSMKIAIELHDGYTDQTATAKLELMRRDKLPRPVVRKNSTATGSENASRNFTHPVIFLSLKRLYPIADREYKVNNFDYLQQKTQKFLDLTNELLNRNSSLATGTVGTISSAVAHGENYDQESVSAGEDNAGQIILALMSFMKLKEEYPDYKGGLLLIDEADAGLFPTAQVNLLKMLDRECRHLDLQVVMTSHSPTLIEYAFEQSQKPHQRKFRTIYLSNTFADVQVMQDWSWAQITADIHTRTITTASGVSLPKVNVYFEDKEAEDFFAELMSRQPVKKFTNPMSGVTLGCDYYLQLIQKRVPEFSEKSVICLDSDAAPKVNGKNFKTVLILPGGLPPDQLLFEFLYNLPAGHEFWRNESQFTRDVFTNDAREVTTAFSINGDHLDVKERLAAYQGTTKPREIFKRFYKSVNIQSLVASGAKPYNPWKQWVKNNATESNEFLNNFKAAIHGVMKNGYAVDAAKLVALEVKLKKV
jgi:AcrR family transcriptional regulator